MSMDPKDEATKRIIADLDHYAQLMLAGAMPPMPEPPCDASPSSSLS